jgi:hypothetical protein
MSASRIVPILLLGLLAFVGLLLWGMAKKNEVLEGVVVQDVSTYEFYSDAKDCNYRGSPYVILPNERFHEIFVTSSGDLGHLNRIFHSTWRAKLIGNLSAIGWHKYRKTYWRELSVNSVIDAVQLGCGEAH